VSTAFCTLQIQHSLLHHSRRSFTTEDTEATEGAQSRHAGSNATSASVIHLRRVVRSRSLLGQLTRVERCAIDHDSRLDGRSRPHNTLLFPLCAPSVLSVPSVVRLVEVCRILSAATRVRAPPEAPKGRSPKKPNPKKPNPQKAEPQKAEPRHACVRCRGSTARRESARAWPPSWSVLPTDLSDRGHVAVVFSQSGRVVRRNAREAVRQEETGREEQPRPPRGRLRSMSDRWRSSIGRSMLGFRHARTDGGVRGRRSGVRAAVPAYGVRTRGRADSDNDGCVVRRPGNRRVERGARTHVFTSIGWGLLRRRREVRRNRAASPSVRPCLGERRHSGTRDTRERDRGCFSGNLGGSELTDQRVRATFAGDPSSAATELPNRPHRTPTTASQRGGPVAPASPA
jgi:hypothetical protein